MATSGRPLLSICVPTHTGRREEVSFLLRTALAQLSDDRGGRVQICVSDNASRDGTAEVLRELSAAHPDRLVVRRQPREIGASRNVFAAIDLAQGEYCWMLSSDDAPAPGAVWELVEWLDRERPEGGLTVDWTTWNRTLDQRLLIYADEVKPSSPGSPARYRSYGEILANLGLLFTYMSIHVFRVDAWRRERERDGEDWLGSSPLFAHVLGLGAIARSTQDWSWVPLAAVRERINAGDEDGGRFWALQTHAIGRVWRRLAGSRSEPYQTLLRRWYHMCATPQHILYYKQEPRHGVWGDLRLLGMMGRTLVADAEFRRNTLPVLMLPASLVRSSPRLRAHFGAWADSGVSLSPDTS